MTEESQGLGSRAFDAAYGVLAQIPESLFEAVVAHPHGELFLRVQGVMQWRNAFLAGQLPDVGVVWPTKSAADGLRSVLAELGVVRFAQGDESLTDALLLSVLEAVREGHTIYLRSLEEQMRSLRALEEATRKKAASASVKTLPPASQQKGRQNQKTAKSLQSLGEIVSYGSTATPVLDSDGTSKKLGGMEGTHDALFDLDARRQEAERLAQTEANKTTREQLWAAWSERVRIWLQLEEVFGSLRDLLGLGWDLSRGILRSQGWLEIARLQKLLERLPTLRELVRVLGRMQSSQDQKQASISQTIWESISRRVEELREEKSPFVPAEARGIERSSSIARMLPSEAALLTHPTLKLLWHARRTEHTLLSYRLEGTEWVSSAFDQTEEKAKEIPRLERGPIMVCLDTSGSMAGVPEHVAKALTLEVMRVAYQEKRACYLYAFSGPSDVVEHELSLSPKGLTQLLSFLSMSFHGGTDISLPTTRALGRLQEEGWRRADVLLISDGEFAVPTHIRENVRKAKDESGLRVHGVLIGNAASAGMDALAEPVHRFTDWEAAIASRRG